MSKATVIRYRTKGPAETEENVRLIRAVFEQLASDGPAGAQYAVYQLGDGQDFMHVVTGDGSALSEVSAIKDFQRGIADRIAAPPTVTESTRLGEYPPA